MAWPGWYPYPGIWYGGPYLSFGPGFGIGFFGGFGWGWNHWGFNWGGHYATYGGGRYYSRSSTFYNRSSFRVAGKEHAADFPAFRPRRREHLTETGRQLGDMPHPVGQSWHPLGSPSPTSEKGGQTKTYSYTWKLQHGWWTKPWRRVPQERESVVAAVAEPSLMKGL